MLLQNQTLHAQYPYRRRGASTVATEAGSLRSQLGIRGSSQLTRFVSGWDKWQSIPQGYGIDSSVFPPLKAGGLGASAGIDGAGTFAGSLASGKACSATLSGSGDIVPPAISAIVQAAATLAGSGALTGSLVGTVQMAATLAGQGDIDGALNVIAFCVATLSGQGTVSSSSTLKEIAHMAATIYVNAGTADAQQIAAQVWESLAADFNSAGTMGNKMNAAGSAGDPWSTIIPGGYTGDQAGAQVLTKKKFLALK